LHFCNDLWCVCIFAGPHCVFKCLHTKCLHYSTKDLIFFLNIELLRSEVCCEGPSEFVLHSLCWIFYVTLIEPKFITVKKWHDSLNSLHTSSIFIVTLWAPTQVENVFQLLYSLCRFNSSLHLKSSFCTCYNGRYLETNVRFKESRFYLCTTLRTFLLIFRACDRILFFFFRHWLRFTDWWHIIQALEDTGSGRNIWRFWKTVMSGTVGVGILSLSALLAKLKAFK
jgi:hypothetical protein